MALHKVDPSKELSRQPILLKNNIFDAQLYTNIAIPSSIHAYSIGIEYAKKWFFKGIPEDFFKFIWVNSSHLMADYRIFNKQHIKKEKPYLAIIPVPDMEHDRDRIDFYNAGNQMWLKRSNWQGSFFKDYKNRLFLNIQMREMKLNFQFRVRVNTRAQQLDLYRRLETIFAKRTYTDWISAEFVIPWELCTNIAYFAGFEFNTIGEIKDPLAFLKYLNSHSDIPVVYKFRAINGHNEFFIRMSDVYAHTSTLENMDLDEGEKSGMLDTNFGITVPLELKMAVPQLFVFYNENELKYKLDNGANANIALYSMAQFTVPDVNEKGWTQIINTACMLEEGETEIDISPLFASNETMNVKQVIEYCQENFISPRSFIEIKMYQDNACGFRELEFSTDYYSFKLSLTGYFNTDAYVYIAVYIDLEFMNSTLVNINDFYKNRVSENPTKIDKKKEEEKKKTEKQKLLSRE